MEDAQTKAKPKPYISCCVPEMKNTLDIISRLLQKKNKLKDTAIRTIQTKTDKNRFKKKKGIS